MAVCDTCIVPKVASFGAEFENVSTSGASGLIGRSTPRPTSNRSQLSRFAVALRATAEPGNLQSEPGREQRTDVFVSAVVQGPHI